jgi:nucleoside-diphosphate-sugar epimerase
VITDNQTNYGIIPRPELDYLLAERRKKIRQTSQYRYNIADKLNIDYLFTFERFDMVIHMASFPRQKVVNADPAGGARVMMEGLINLLEASKRTGVKKFMYISSSMVYGDFTDDVTEDAVCSPQGQYGIMKLAGEHLVKDYARRDCFNYTIIRPSAVYGPLDVEDRVVSKFMLAAMQGRVLRINGERETLDFTYVDDAADGIVAAALSNNTANKTYNITKSHSVTLHQAAQMAVALAGSGEIQLGDRDPDFPSRGALNIDAARQDFGFNPQVDVAEGFERYHQWFLASEYWQGKLNAN